MDKRLSKYFSELGKKSWEVRKKKYGSAYMSLIRRKNRAKVKPEVINS